MENKTVPAYQSDKRPEYPFDFIESLDQEEWAFVGVSAYSSFKYKNIWQSTIWQGYNYGKPFFFLRTQFKAKHILGLKFYNYYNDIQVLIETIGRKYENPLLLVPSKYVVNGFKRNMPFKHEFLKLFPHLRYLAATFPFRVEHYFPLAPPFSLLRERVWVFNKEIREGIAGKTFYDYSGWGEGLTDDGSGGILDEA